MTSAYFYFLYFAGVGVYVPYWTLYLLGQGLTSLQIATIYAIPSVARVLFSWAYGYAADRFQKRKTVLLAAACAQVLPLLALPFTDSYTVLFLLITIYSICNAPILPFVDATVQEEHERGHLDYGRTRMWGTISFIVTALLFGKLLESHSENLIVYGFIVFQALPAALLFRMPEGKHAPRFEITMTEQILRRKNTVLFLICVFLMAVSHGTLYGFYSIHLKQLGIGQSAIGLQWGIAAAGEVLVFLFASRILARFSYSFLFSGCLLIATLRWLLTYSSTSYVLLSGTQSLHAFTFGVFHITCIRLVHQIFPAGYRSLGQSLYNTGGAGLGTLTGILLGGTLWDALGSAAFAASGMLVLVAFFVSLGLNKDAGSKVAEVEDRQRAFPDRQEIKTGE